MNQHDPSIWQLRSDLDRLRAEFDSAKDDRVRLRRDIDTVAADVKMLLTIPVEVKNLTTSLDRLSERLESLTSAAQAGQRWAWDKLLGVVGVVGMFVTIAITLARLR